MSWGIFITAIICIYYVITIVSAIDQSIVRLQNAVNSLDERVKKLEKDDFYTWNPYSDED
jgi:hypothetical protein